MKLRWNRSRKLSSVTFAVMLTAGGLALTTAAPATAASGNCTALKDVKVVNWAPDPVRVIASCSSLSASSEARGYLDMLGCCDKETSWFSKTNTNYYSDWASGNYERVGIDFRDR
ncbi:hypothetical protein O7622_26720 [Micromonospora sp. WMMD1076]|uniref:hypothetical protein n=1 Tax=Micromonospora TaxID=1873 RepID=UPI00249A7C78|nr:hypothetical protein [Micromonospora sp. WMMD1076]WFF06597.1 hypothetical protein O7622_26720 [Micromonospora sp. WMMD1076]